MKYPHRSEWSKAKWARQAKTWHAWSDMRKRCLNKNNSSYRLYGARGITICERWRLHYDNFLMDMGIAPSGLSLDRIDNNKGYELSNCRWVSAKEQQHNTRRNQFITFNGETKCLNAWVPKLGVTQSAICHYAKRHKLTVQQVVIKRLKLKASPVR